MTIVKQVISHIVKPLSYICNMSLTSGICPNNIKFAKVIPLYKANGKNEFNNCRPVSLLPQFSKILEKLFGIRLDSFIDRYNLLSSNQCGFRRNMSTSLALMELTEEITTALDVERSSSVVECRTRNRESPGSNPPLLPFRRLGIFRSLHRRPCSLSCINEYLAIDSG